MIKHCAYEKFKKKMKKKIITYESTEKACEKRLKNIKKYTIQGNLI